MKTLPFDCYRCIVKYPDERCRECLRWVDLPGQTFGPRTAQMSVLKPGDQGCDFIPIYPSEGKKK
jgi:hypothetical protein